MLATHLISELERLLLDKSCRFAIAFSGGGDSTALVHALKDHPQRGPVFIVDHALRKGSDTEAQAAKRFAQTYGYEAHVLTWQHNSPKTGVQDKARRARYGLMGQACRHLGIEYLLTAHSEDDQAETLLMRYDKKTDWRGAAGISAISYAPVWPELAMVNICRPLLGLSRQKLRDYNKAHDLKWVEDPSNENRDYSRIRARDYLSSHNVLKDELLLTAKDLQAGLSWEQDNLEQELEAAKFGPAGDVTFSRLPSCEMLGLALRAGGGSGGAISRQRLRARYCQLKTGQLRAMTLLGGQAVRDNQKWHISRDPVAVTGRSDKGLKPRAVPMTLTAQLQIWDGRFVVSAKREGYEIRPNSGLTHERSIRLKTMLASLHKSVRPTCPVIISGDMAYACDEVAEAEIKSLVQTRLKAALMRNPL